MAQFAGPYNVLMKYQIDGFTLDTKERTLANQANCQHIRPKTLALLLYLAEKFGAFLPEDPAGRTETLNWLFWQMGAAPYLGGGFGHFFAYAPEKLEYPINRFTMEAKRQLDVLDRRLGESRYLAGEHYTIADIAVWSWYGQLVRNTVYSAAEFLAAQDYIHVQRWAEERCQLVGRSESQFLKTAGGLASDKKKIVIIAFLLVRQRWRRLSS